jgi:transformation/transcription domain-associated protein
MLADLIHHVRQELSQEQIAKTIRLYTQNLHDSSLAPSIQTMCAKLLLNLIDCIVNDPNKEEGLFHLMICVN